MERCSKGVMLADRDNSAMKTLKHLDRKEYESMKDCSEFGQFRERLLPYAGKNEY